MSAEISRAVLAGASGFIGQKLRTDLERRGYQVRVIGREADVSWQNPAAIRQVVDGADLLVNLAGKNVGCRYHDAAREEILRSRLQSTRTLHQAVSAAKRPPRLWMNSSTATIYRHATDHAQDEFTGEIGHGFSVDVARNWEREFFRGELPGTRRVALRMAIVLGDGPATNKLLALARYGLGGAQHDGWWPAHRRYRGIGPDPSGPERSGWYRTGGRQRFSWVHLDDVLGSIRFIETNPEICGPVNICAPQPVTNRELMAQLRQTVGRSFGMPAYRWMLEPAMFLLRVEPEMLLKSRWVVPGILQQAGYRFHYPELSGALENVARLTR